jgi:hypothetical protein
MTGRCSFLKFVGTEFVAHNRTFEPSEPMLAQADRRKQFKNIAGWNFQFAKINVATRQRPTTARLNEDVSRPS